MGFSHLHVFGSEPLRHTLYETAKALQIETLPTFALDCLADCGVLMQPILDMRIQRVATMVTLPHGPETRHYICSEDRPDYLRELGGRVLKVLGEKKRSAYTEPSHAQFLMYHANAFIADCGAVSAEKRIEAVDAIVQRISVSCDADAIYFNKPGYLPRTIAVRARRPNNSVSIYYKGVGPRLAVTARDPH